jgi:hypothetical protein
MRLIQEPGSRVATFLPVSRRNAEGRWRRMGGGRVMHANHELCRPPLNGLKARAEEWVAGGTGLWWKFTTDGEHVLYEWDEQTGYIAPVDEVDVLGSTTSTSVANGGVFAQFAAIRLDQIAVNTTGVQCSFMDTGCCSSRSAVGIHVVARVT